MDKGTFAALLAAAALASCASGSSSHGAKPGRVGGPVPKWSLPSASGSTLSSQQFAGKPLYINFFATWCPPCNAEAPDINALQKKYASQGLQVVGVDEAEDTSKAQSFVKKFGLVYPAVADDGSLEDAFLVNGLPVHVFVARNGTIKQIRVGEMNASQIEASIRSIL